MEHFLVATWVFLFFSSIALADPMTPAPNSLNDPSLDHVDVDGSPRGTVTPDTGELGSRATPVDLQVKTTSDEIGAPVQSTQAQQAVTGLNDSGNDPLSPNWGKTDNLTPAVVGEPIENDQQKKALQALDQGQMKQQGPELTPTPTSDGL